MGCPACGTQTDAGTPTLYIGPQCLNITVFPGLSAAGTFTLNTVGADCTLGPPFDLTPYTSAKMVITDPQNNNAVVDTLETNPPGDGRLIMGGTAGTITFDIKPSQMTGYPNHALTYLATFGSSSGDVYPVAYGCFAITNPGCT